MSPHADPGPISGLRRGLAVVAMVAGFPWREAAPAGAASGRGGRRRASMRCGDMRVFRAEMRSWTPSSASSVGLDGI